MLSLGARLNLAGLAGVMAAAPCFSVPRVRGVLLRVLAAAPAPT